MVLINVPKSLLHDCSNDVVNHELDERSSNQDLPSFKAEECDFCAYTFHSLDLPDLEPIHVPRIEVFKRIHATPISSPSDELQIPDSRGPPCSLNIL